MKRLHVASTVRCLRLAANMSSQELSKKINISAPALSNLEAGRYQPGLEKQQEIVQAFGISTSQFCELLKFAQFNKEDYRKLLRKCIDVLDEADKIKSTKKHFEEVRENRKKLDNFYSNIHNHNAI